MAHWAELDDNNVVLRVTVGSNDDADEGYQWLIDNLGGNWVKTSYNTFGGVHTQGKTPLRKNYAGIGFIYDEDLDAFYAPQPYPSWILNEETCLWEAPVSNPNDELYRYWNEDEQQWQITE